MVTIGCYSNSGDNSAKKRISIDSLKIKTGTDNCRVSHRY